KFKSLKFFCFIPILNFVLSINPSYDRDVALASRGGQVQPYLRSDLSSLPENLQFFHPLASSSAAFKPSIKSSLPYEPVVIPSWQNLAQHQNNHFEHLFAHQSAPYRSEKASNFDVASAPQVGQAPQDLRPELNCLPENLQLLNPLASNSAALTPNLESSFTHQPFYFPSRKNLVHKNNPNEDLRIIYENSMNYYDDHDYFNESIIMNNFLAEENLNGNSARTNTAASSSSYQDSYSQNKDRSFKNLVDFDPVDAHFNSISSACMQPLSPKEKNINGEKICSSLLDEETSKKNTAESLKKNKIPSDPAEEADNLRERLFLSPVNEEILKIFEAQNKVEKSSKYLKIVKPQKLKRKHNHISESEIAKGKEQNLEDLKVFWPVGGSINRKFMLKNYLDGFMVTSGVRLEAAHEELKMSLAEPGITYELLKPNKKNIKEKQSSAHGHPLNSSQSKIAWESIMKETKKITDNSASKTKYSKYFTPNKLKTLRDIVFKELKLQRHDNLKSLDKFLSDIYRKAKSESLPDYVIGSLVDWNVEKTIEQRIEYILEYDEELRKKATYTIKVKDFQEYRLNQNNEAIIKEASKKIKHFWKSYSEIYRLEHLPSNKKNVKQELLVEKFI
ncbi:expressed protein, partial [Phakopsora pachyrhizi]